MDVVEGVGFRSRCSVEAFWNERWRGVPRGRQTLRQLSPAPEYRYALFKPFCMR